MEQLTVYNAHMKFKETDGNKPLNRPGVYLLTNVSNGKNYVGISINLRRRILSHLHSRPSAPVLFKAIRKYGPEGFLVTPLYYSIDGTDHLPKLEAEFIKEYRSTAHGYNIQQASGAVGPYGSIHGEAVRRAKSTPEARMKMSASAKARMSTPEARAIQGQRSKKLWQDPNMRAQMITKLCITMNDPEFRAKRSSAISSLQTPELIAARTEKMKSTINGTEYKQRHNAMAKLNQNDPVIREKIETAMRATMATPEFKEKRSAASLAMQSPQLKQKKSASLKAAYAADPALGEKISASKRGRIWITDGCNNRCIKPIELIPEGWRRGSTHRKK